MQPQIIDIQAIELLQLIVAISLVTLLKATLSDAQATYLHRFSNFYPTKSNTLPACRSKIIIHWKTGTYTHVDFPFSSIYTTFCAIGTARIFRVAIIVFCFLNNLFAKMQKGCAIAKRDQRDQRDPPRSNPRPVSHRELVRSRRPVDARGSSTAALPLYPASAQLNFSFHSPGTVLSRSPAWVPPTAAYNTPPTQL